MDICSKVAENKLNSFLQISPDNLTEEGGNVRLLIYNLQKLATSFKKDTKKYKVHSDPFVQKFKHSGISMQSSEILLLFSY